MVDTEHGMTNWRSIAAMIREALPQIDSVLSKHDVALAKRRSESINLICNHMLETNVDRSTLIVSESYARIVALIDDSYCRRYGPGDETKQDLFASVIFPFDTPFAFDVPLTFTKLGAEKGSAWFAFPACVQPEENPLDWIVNGPTIGPLVDAERAEVMGTDRMGTDPKTSLVDSFSRSRDHPNVYLVAARFRPFAPQSDAHAVSTCFTDGRPNRQRHQ